MKIFARVFFALALIILVAKAASAQVYTGTAYRSKVTDSTTVSMPTGYGGWYYNYQTGKIRMKDADGWFNPRSSGGSVNPYLFIKRNDTTFIKRKTIINVATDIGNSDEFPFSIVNSDVAATGDSAKINVYGEGGTPIAEMKGIASTGETSLFRTALGFGYFKVANSTGTQDFGFEMDFSGGALFEDGRSTPLGLIYGSPPSAINMVNGTLVHKQYVVDNFAASSTAISGNTPIRINGGNSATLAAGPIITINNAAADAATKGAATFTANDFNAASGLISIDYVNAQQATTSLNGFLSSTDWNTFNNKLSSSRTITTTAPLLIDGGSSADLSANRTLSIISATTAALGVASFNASDFDVTAGAVSFDNTNAQKATTSTNGILTSTDWNTFNSKQAGSAVLTTIAGLSPATNDFMQYKAGAWANRTPTQALADLSAISTATTWGGKQNLTTTTTLAGLNVGSFAGNPSSLSDYDFWVNSSTTNISMRLAGQTVIVPRIGSGGGLTNSIPYLASSGGSFMNQSANFTFNGTTFSINGLTTLAANTSAIQTTGALLFRSTSADIINLFKTGNTVTTAATNQVMNSFLHNNSYTASHTGLVVNGFIHDPTISGVQSGSAINKAFAASSGQFVMGSLTPTTGLLMDLQSTTQGFRMPTMTTTQMNAIGSPAEGFMVMNNTTHTPYFHNGTAWGPISSGGGISGLTTNRIPYATSSTTIGDDAGLTYDATNDEVTSRFKAAPTATLAGFSFGSTASDPSAPTAGGAWYNSANDVVVWKGASTKYYLPSVTAAIGAGRIQFGGVSGNFSLADNSGLTYNTGTSTLSTVNLTATGLAGTDSGIPVIDATGSFSRYPFYDITNFTNTANTFSYNVTATTAQPISSSWEYEFYGTGVDATTGAYGYKITAVVIRNSSGNYSIVGVNSTDIKSTGVTTATVTIVSNAVQLDVTTGLTGAKNHIRVTILSKSNQ